MKLEERKITIKDMRGKEETFDFNTNGFAVVKLDSKISFEDFNDSKMIRNVYCKEIEARVWQCLSTDSVCVFYTDIKFCANSIKDSKKPCRVPVHARCSCFCLCQ